MEEEFYEQYKPKIFETVWYSPVDVKQGGQIQKRFCCYTSITMVFMEEKKTASEKLQWLLFKLFLKRLHTVEKEACFAEVKTLATMFGKSTTQPKNK